MEDSKKVCGKVHYFTGTREEALNEWLRVKDDLLAGHGPREKTTAVTVKTLLNKFLSLKEDGFCRIRRTDSAVVERLQERLRLDPSGFRAHSDD